MEQSLLPKSSTDLLVTEFDVSAIPSLTWHVDFKRNRVVGMADGLEAVKQNIYVILNTSRFRHIIYSWNHGCEHETLIGKPKDYAKAEIPRLTRECLEQDDRIIEVRGFVFTDSDDGLHVSFEAITMYGDIGIETEVRV